MFALTRYAMAPRGMGAVVGSGVAFWQVMLFEYLFLTSVAQGK